MKKTCLFSFVLLTAALQAINISAQSAQGALVVHEWGTFTSLQNESGQAIGGINTDDEPVPPFVHRLAEYLLLNPTEVPVIFFQGAPRCHPDVTMRLETPVLYFHPTPDQPKMEGVDVSAKFRGGWLSEFYPDAEAHAPGVQSNATVFGPLSSNTVSSLAWNNLRIGGDWRGPATTEHVWTSPRAVSAAAVRTSAGEAENFLFYRGVAHLDAPIAVSQIAEGQELALRSQWPSEVSVPAPSTINSLWLVDISADGKVAFKSLPPVKLSDGKKTATLVPGTFAPGDYREANRDKLKSSLRGVLVGEGLFDDEAQALLNTWELSYFKSPGMRIFFMVPRAWTDFYLPLSISAPAQVTRVMVGRIELVTSQQRALLHEIAQISTNTIYTEMSRLHNEFYGRMTTNPKQVNNVNGGGQSLETFGVSVPKSYQMYLSLGRFRNALILDEAKYRPTLGLSNFISTYRLEGYRPLEISEANSGGDR